MSGVGECETQHIHLGCFYEEVVGACHICAVHKHSTLGLHMVALACQYNRNSNQACASCVALPEQW